MVMKHGLEAWCGSMDYGMELRRNAEKHRGVRYHSIPPHEEI